MASESSFNPYHKWLGIPPADQPPHHYRLLALQLYEDDPEVIHSAADQRMAHVRTFQSGTHSEDSQKLLNELAAARICLLKPERKAAYDAELKAKLAPRTPASDPMIVSAPAVEPPATGAPPTPLAAPAPPSYSVQPISWASPSLPTAIPVVRSAAPTAIPVQPPGAAYQEETDSEDLPFEIISGRSFRRARSARKTDPMPLFLILIGILLFVGIVLAVSMKERANPTRQRLAEAPGKRAPAAQYSTDLPRKASAKPRRTSPSARVTPLPPMREPVGEPLTVPFPGHARQLPSVIDDADPSGFRLSGSGWQMAPGAGRAFRGSVAWRLPHDDAAAAEWSFDGLEPGKRYDIFVTWAPDATSGSQAWYGIRDGDLGSRFLVVDQSIAPRPDVLVENHPFQRLATVPLTSGILTVRLEGGAGDSLQADAVLLTLVPDRESTDE